MEHKISKEKQEFLTKISFSLEKDVEVKGRKYGIALTKVQARADAHLEGKFKVMQVTTISGDREVLQTQVISTATGEIVSESSALVPTPEEVRQMTETAMVMSMKNHPGQVYNIYMTYLRKVQISIVLGIQIHDTCDDDTLGVKLATSQEVLKKLDPAAFQAIQNTEQQYMGTAAQAINLQEKIKEVKKNEQANNNTNPKQ